MSNAPSAHAAAGDPASAVKVIAVTGTSGKTTTTWLAAAVLAEAGRRVGVLSDLGCLDADAALPESAAYGGPAELAAWLGRFAVSGCTHAVVEVSSRMLASRSLAAASAAIVAVPNIATVRRDAHGTWQGSRALPGRLLESLDAAGCLVTGTPSAPLDRLRRRAVRECPGIELLAAGLASGCDVTAVPVERGLFGQ
ncbi:MAG: Mur ligase family protein, partial [Planctomycetia bacterium]